MPIYQREKNKTDASSTDIRATRRAPFVSTHLYIEISPSDDDDEMSTSSQELGCSQTTSPSCVTCSNPVIEGSFGPRHNHEHRDILRQQLNEIIHEREQFLGHVDPKKLPASILFDHIDRWEKESIGRIQHVAQQARLDLQHIAGRQRGKPICTRPTRSTPSLPSFRQYHGEVRSANRIVRSSATGRSLHGTGPLPMGDSSRAAQVRPDERVTLYPSSIR